MAKINSSEPKPKTPLSKTCSTLNNSINYDMLSLEDMRILYILKEKDTILCKYTFPKKPTSDGYYHIYVSDETKKNGRKAVKAKTLELLIEKVYLHEKGITGKARKTFQDVFEIVQQEIPKYIIDPEKLLSVQNTISRNRSEYKRYFSGTAFERKYIDEITVKDIEHIVYINLSQKDMHEKSLASMRAILNAVFNLASSEYWIVDNPYKRTNFKKYINMTKESVPISKRAYSDNDISKFLDYLHEYQELKPSYLPAYALELQILSGFRRGEIPPLQWNDIHDDRIYIHREQITVKRTKNKPEHFVIVSHTKNQKDRYFPITDDIKDLLERLKKAHKRIYPKSLYLFPAKSDNGVITNNTVYNFYRRMIKKLGYKQEKGVIIGTHSFRRNAITNTVNNSNGNLVMTALLFGNSPEVIQKNYFTGIDIQEATEILNQKNKVEK